MKKEIKYTNTGYSYVECTKEECYNWGGGCICDDCNEEMQGSIYLVFVLGRALCKKCFDEWQKHSHRYEEDLQFQTERHIAYYKAHGLEVKQ